MESFIDNTEINNIEINNNVLVEDLYDNKTWIHGNEKSNIKITFFLVTICGDQLKYALIALNKLNLNYSIIINVIMNISPTNKAYNMMRERCVTPYFVQYDEDMEIYENGIDMMMRWICNRSEKEFVAIFNLYDNYFGTIQGMKIYNNDIMKMHPTSNNQTSVSSVDRLWHDSVITNGYEIKNIQKIIGTHAKHRDYFDILLRYSKITSCFFINVRITSGDKCKILKPLNVLCDGEFLRDSIIMHYMANFTNINLYTNNFDVLSDKLSHVQKNILESHSIPSNYVSYQNNKNEFNVNIFMKLFKVNMKSLMHIYAMIGTINRLFDNYQYSYDKYPYEMNNYFTHVFTFKLCIITTNNMIFNDIINNITQKFPTTRLFIFFNLIVDNKNIDDANASIKQFELHNGYMDSYLNTTNVQFDMFNCYNDINNENLFIKNAKFILCKQNYKNEDIEKYIKQHYHIFIEDDTVENIKYNNNCYNINSKHTLNKYDLFDIII